jgi:hypothetical protein
MSYACTPVSVSLKCDFCGVLYTMLKEEFTEEEWNGLVPENRVWNWAEGWGWKHGVTKKLDLVDACTDCKESSACRHVAFLIPI